MNVMFYLIILKNIESDVILMMSLFQGFVILSNVKHRTAPDADVVAPSGLVILRPIIF